MQAITINDNQLSGTLPPMSSRVLKQLDISNNKFRCVLDLLSAMQSHAHPALVTSQVTSGKPMHALQLPVLGYHKIHSMHNAYNGA